MKNFIAPIALAAATLLSSATASAGVVSFNIGGTYTQGNGVGDLSPTVIGLGGAGSFTLDPGSSNAYFDFLKPGGGTFSTTGFNIEGYYFMRSYVAGEIIGNGNFGTQVSVVNDWDSILVNGSTHGVWNNAHKGYLGFKTATNQFGWIGYEYSRPSGNSSIKFINGAYESTANANITAGAVPEPGTLALMGLALLGMGALRRRK